MKHYSQRYKVSGQNASKLKARNNGQLSVTNADKVTDERSDPPSKRYARLEPWLWLANVALRRGDGRLLPPEVARRDDQALEELRDRVEAERETREDGALAELYRIIAVSNVHHSFREKFEWLCGLTYGAAYFFESCAKGEDAVVNTAGGFAHLGTGDGWATITISDPDRDFLSALDGTRINRVRRCPVCQRLFYAVRVTQKACSERCNQTRRVREWRRNQSVYEQNRKFRLAGVRPKRK